MGLFDFLSNLIDFAEDLSTYEDMQSTVMEFWYGAADTGNPGQASIAYDYCIPAGEEVIDGWEGEWPDIDPGEYGDACYDAHEAAEACWSDTIEEIVGIINMFQEEAQDGQGDFFGGEEDDDGGDDEGED